MEQETGFALSKIAPLSVGKALKLLERDCDCDIKGGRRKTADLGVLGQKQARVKIERGKSTTSALLRAVHFQADKDTQIAARGCVGEARRATTPVMEGGSLSDTAGSGQTDCQIGVAAGTSAQLLLLISKHRRPTMTLVRRGAWYITDNYKQTR